MVKPKTGIWKIFTGFNRGWSSRFLPVLAVLTFISSWAALYPTGLTERWFSHQIYPKVSYAFGRFADAAPFSWLDAAILAAVPFLVIVIRRRKWASFVNVV